MSTIIVHWPRLGPYHIARLRAATEYFAGRNLRLVALEIFGASDEYLWERAGNEDRLERHTLFPHASMLNTSATNLFQGIWNYLNRLQPQAIAINGYSSWDSWALLSWCRMKTSYPVLMSDSKWDDAPRNRLVEGLKKMLVRQYGAALCAGTPQRKYLEGLGMQSHKIFDGYDVIDNQFFEEESDKARRSPEKYRSLPGLENERPFFLASGRFIPRKNFSVLLKAYAIYKEQCRKDEKEVWRLLVLGDGTQREPLLNEIQTLGLQFDVVLAGVQSIEKLPLYYGLASAFIHPALQDQWGLVVNEAMASGLPVLVSDKAGCAFDLIEDGVEGFTFTPEDVTSLAQLMSHMSSGQVDLVQMGMAARRKISNWGVERFSQGLYRAIRVGLSK